MEQIDQILIERYLAQEMTSSERSEVERRAEIDPQFKKDLAAYKLSLEAIKLSQRDELMNRFRQRDKVLDKKNNSKSDGKRLSFWWLSVAASVSILVAAYFLYTPDRIIDEASNDKKDSTILVHVPPVVIDSSQSKENKTEPVQPKNPGKRNGKKPVQPKANGEQFFAANFEAYKDESMDIASRSDDEDLSPTDKLLINYWEGNLKEAQIAFGNLTPENKQNDNYRFIYANILMSFNKTDEASLLLNGVIKNNKSPYTPEAYFYLALCDIKSGKNAEAQENLKIYLDDKNSTQKDKAKRILAGLQ